MPYDPSKPAFNHAFEMRSLPYERMKYGYEQRDWVREIKIPEYERKAIRCQKEGAILFEDWQEMTIRERKLHPFTFTMATEAYSEARQHLQRAIYYRGMLEANKPETKETKEKGD